MGQGEATRLRNNRGRRNAEFRRAGKYRVILTVIAGGLTHHNWNSPYFAARCGTLVARGRDDTDEKARQG